MMKPIKINSHKINTVFYQNHMLTIEFKTGEKFLYRPVALETFEDFLDAPDKDKFYKTYIQFNDGFKRVRILG